MKTRRLTVVAFLLAAVMIIGIGFAALTDKLDILGAAEISQTQAETTFDGDIYFDDTFTATKNGATISTDGTNGGITVAYSNTDTSKDTVSFNVTNLTEVGQYVEITCTIVNEFAAEADLTAAITNTRDDVFTVSTDWTTADIAGKSGDDAGTKSIVVKIELRAIPSATANASISVKITATVPDA